MQVGKCDFKSLNISDWPLFGLSYARCRSKTKQQGPLFEKKGWIYPKLSVWL